jgi:O-methyltransferase
MKEFLKKILKVLGLFDQIMSYYYCIRAVKSLILRYLSFEQRSIFLKTEDPVRYGAIYLAINRIISYDIPGAFAEIGVYRGYTSRIIHMLAPDRKLILFDTFDGFPDKDLDSKSDKRFVDTSIDLVKKVMGNMDNVYFRKGYFPETALGLENERFAFVMLDVDLYGPTLSGLEFFYSRLSPGGYIFIHDYNSPESDWAVSRAVNEFMINKPESIICIPDAFGSAIICKDRRLPD